MGLRVLFHQQVFAAVRIVTELQEAAVVDKAVDDGSGRDVVAEAGAQRNQPGSW